MATYDPNAADREAYRRQLVTAALIGVLTDSFTLDAASTDASMAQRYAALALDQADAILAEEARRAALIP